jgi:hypothetical protein
MSEPDEPNLPGQQPPVTDPEVVDPPVTVSQAPVTGQPAVDVAIRALAEVSEQPPAEQLPAYQAAHRTLRETLASIDEEG